MSERYSRLYAQEKSLYAVGSPVAITASALLKDTQTGKVLAQVKYTNISRKKIKALTVSIQPKDTIGNILGTPVEYQYLDLSAERDQSFGQKVPVTLPDNSTRSFDAEVIEVIFADNTIWNSNNEPWEVLPARITIEDVIKDPQLRTQFRLEYGQGCRYWYQTHKDLWYCTCGLLNHESENGCHKCGQTVSRLASLNMTELEQRSEERLVREKAEREKKAAEQAEAQRKNAGIFKKAAIVAAIIAILAATIFYVVNVALPERQYKEAVSLMENGQFENAKTIFIELGDYKDSAEQVIVAEMQPIYNRAEELLATSNKAEAAWVFDTISDYSDAAERSAQLKWEYAPKYSIGIDVIHAVGLTGDGRLVSTGSNTSKQRNTSSLTNGGGKIISVDVGAWLSAVLKDDGTVRVVGDVTQKKINEIHSWKDIISIAANSRRVVGLKSDGTVVASGAGTNADVSKWKKIVAVSCSENSVIGLKSDGTVVAAGRNEDGQMDVTGWSDIIAISSGGYWGGDEFTVGLKKDGTVVAVGDNEYGSCDVSDWTDIVAISAGVRHTVGLKSDGTVVAVGWNEDGQCNVSDWSDIVEVYAGYDETIGIRSDGTALYIGGDEGEPHENQSDIRTWRNIGIPNR